MSASSGFSAAGSLDPAIHHDLDPPPERGARYSDLFDSGPHPPDCAFCPICTTIGILRRTDPAVLEHVAAATRELVTAFGLLLERAGETLAQAASSQAPEQRNPQNGSEARAEDPGPVPPVRRIDTR